MALLYVSANPAPPASSAAEAITALAGGGQVGATLLTGRYNRVTVVATAGDSVILCPWVRDIRILASNDSANALAVFPNGTDQIGAGAASASITVAAGKTAEFLGSGTQGKWTLIQSA